MVVTLAAGPTGSSRLRALLHTVERKARGKNRQLALTGGETTRCCQNRRHSVIEWAEVAVGRDRHDVLGFPSGLVAAHAGRVAGHTWYGESYDVGAILEQTLDGSDRDVAFEDVPVDECRVARCSRVRNPEAATPLCSLGVIDDRCVDSVVCQVPDPAGAASSTGVPPDLEGYAAELSGRRFAGVSGSWRGGRRQLVLGAGAPRCDQQCRRTDQRNEKRPPTERRE